jgi:hypothetical protein
VGITFAAGSELAAVFDVSRILIVWPLWRVCHNVISHDLTVGRREVFLIAIDALLIRFDRLIVFEVGFEVEVVFEVEVG